MKPIVIISIIISFIIVVGFVGVGSFVLIPSSSPPAVEVRPTPPLEPFPAFELRGARGTFLNDFLKSYNWNE